MRWLRELLARLSRGARLTPDQADLMAKVKFPCC